MDDTLIRSTAFLTAIVPSLIVLLYFAVATQTRFENDTMWNAFGLGACAAFPAIVFSQLVGQYVDLGTDIYALSFREAVLEAAIPEELFKFVAILCVCWKNLKTIHPRHLFIVAIACSCGFACFENIFYVVDNNDWETIAIKRSVSAVPGHAFDGAIMGFCVYRALHSNRNWLWWACALVFPVVMHGAYDFFLYAVSYLDARYVGAYTDFTKLMVFMFVITVAAEGLLAHVALKSLVSEHSLGGETSCGIGIWDKFDAISKHSLLWCLVGGLCILGTSYFIVNLIEAPDSADKTFDQGFAAFSILHGIAFLSLAYVQHKRQAQIALEA